MKDDIKVVELNEEEKRIIIFCLNEERNKLDPDSDSREDIRKLILKIINSPKLEKKKNKLFGAR